MIENVRKQRRRYPLRLLSLGLAAVLILGLIAVLAGSSSYLAELHTGAGPGGFTATIVRQYEAPPKPVEPALMSAGPPAVPAAVASAESVYASPAELAEPREEGRGEEAPEPRADGAASAPGRPAPRKTAEVELRGVLLKEGREAHFAMVLYPPEGPPERLSLKLGDPVFGRWTIQELNQDRQTVTLSNGRRLLVLDRNARVALEP